MAACKDCICYEILCRDTLQGDELKPCKDFKNKADFVEVVRCKDCKYSQVADNENPYKIYCFQPAPIKQIVQTEETRFCSYGERRDTE